MNSGQHYDIPLSVSEPGSVQLGVSDVPSLNLGIAENIILSDAPVYEGPYEVDPSSEQQVLNTSGHLLTDDVVINPIPSNYGLITWNGAVLTVS